MAPSERIVEHGSPASQQGRPLPFVLRYLVIVLMGVAVAGLSFYLMRKLGY